MSDQQPPKDVTRLLMDWNKGNEGILQELMPLVFDELHKIARRRFINERSNHTLQPTVLISEVYLRFLGEKELSWKNRAHFFAAASEKMRRILVDHARKRMAEKREGEVVPLSIAGFKGEFQDGEVDILALDDTLTPSQ